MMPRINKLWALFGALVCLFISKSAFAGSGPAPVQLDPTLFRVSQVLHEPGVNAEIIVLYGSSNRAGTVGSQDAARLTSVDGGDNWTFAYLTGPIQTANTDTSTFVCPPGSFCAGKVFVRDGATSQLKQCDIAGDGLTTSNCGLIPTFGTDGGAISLSNDGQLYVQDGVSDQVHKLDTATGTSVVVSGCGTASVAGGPVNGRFYLNSSGAPTVGSSDYQFFSWNGSACFNSKDNLNNLTYYGTINTSGGELEGVIDPLTGDYFYSSASPTKAMWAKHDGVCGDGFLSYSAGEECDTSPAWLNSQYGVGANLNNETCASIMGAGWTGTLGCNGSCGFDTSACTPPVSCGDLSCNNGETCSTCPGDCGSCCGNGAINAGEDCDGANLNGQTCASVQGAGWTGTLSCNSCDFNTSSCIAPPSCGDSTCNNGETCSTCPGDCGVCCGNGAIDSGEDCDGANLGGETCTSVQGPGWTGTLSCNSCDFHTSGCIAPPFCGDSTCNGGETCSSCPGDCGSCCGNGAINSGEACDGGNLNGQTCTSIGQGFVGGTLACDTCQFDTDGCTEPPSCGDGTCNNGETCSSCSQDCGNCCGNGTCDVAQGENPDSCISDCGPCKVVVNTGTCLVLCINPGQPVIQFLDGTDCHLQYTPLGSGNATGLKLAASAGKSLIIPTQPFGTPTQVSVPPGVNHREVVDNGNEYELFMGGVTLGVEGTTYSAEWISESVVRVACTEGLITLDVTASGNPMNFILNGNPGELPEGYTVDVDVMSGSIISGPDLITCGDGNVDAGEECDGNEMNGESCITQGFDTGSISCNDNCTLDLSDCESGQGGSGGSGGEGGSGASGGAGGEGSTSSTGSTTGGSTSTSSSSGGEGGAGGSDDDSNVNAQGGGGCSVSHPTNHNTDPSWMLMALFFGLALAIRRR
jgi:hypothetical protein